MKKRKPKKSTKIRRSGYLKKIGISNKQKRLNQEINYNFMIEYLIAHPCVKCGEKDIIVLEFDHIDRKRKKASVTSLLRFMPPVFKTEIEKCQVLCTNCHRRKTAREANWKRCKAQDARTDLNKD